MTYLIKSTTERDDETDLPLYWQHDQGWVDRGSATRYATMGYLLIDSLWETEDGSEQ